jgi:hypothetical protein
MSPPAPQIDGIAAKSSYIFNVLAKRGESMSTKISIQNLFHILHPIWIHHIKTWILLSKQRALLQMAMKHCTKFQVSLISHKGGEVSI